MENFTPLQMVQILANKGPASTIVDKAISNMSSPNLSSSRVINMLVRTQVTQTRGEARGI